MKQKIRNPFCYEGTKKMIGAVNVEPIDDYCLRVLFSNGAVKIYDFKPELKYPVYQPLNDKKLFSAVKLDGNTAFWDYDWGEDYAYGIDIAPETLYWDGVKCDSKS